MVDFIENGYKRKGVVTHCVICNKEFVVRLDPKRRFKACSQSCRNQYRMRHRIKVTCAGCGQDFFRIKSKLNGSKSGLYFCSRDCKDASQRIGGVKEIMPPHYGTGPVDYRSLFDESELVCARCGYNEFKCSVHIHHIDHDREHNDKTNLIPLCGCCHLALHYNYWRLDDLNGLFDQREVASPAN